MWRKFNILRIAPIAALLATAFAPTPLWACGFAAEFQIEDIKLADAVVVGRVTHYEVVGGHAILTIAVEEPMTGKDYVKEGSLRYSDEVQVSWQNSTFQLPKALPQERRIFAFRRSGSASPPMRGASGVVFPDPKGVEFTILQAPCSSPFMIPYSKMGWGNIQVILDGGRPASFDYLDPESAYMIKFSQQERAIKVVSVIGLLLLLINALTIWKYLKLKRQGNHMIRD